MANPMDDFALARTDFPAWLAKLDTLVTDTLIPNEGRLSDEAGVPDDLAAPLKSMGLFGLTIPERYGGLALDMEQQCLAMIAVTRASSVYRARFSTTVGLSAQAILLNGTEEQCATCLPKLATGQWTSAFALTEENAGSDATNVETTARRDGNGYVLNGTKRYITNSNIADLFVVMARSDETKPGADGISAFLVERGTPGLTVGAVDKKMGQAGAPLQADASGGEPRAGCVGRRLRQRRLHRARGRRLIGLGECGEPLVFRLRRHRHGRSRADFGIQCGQRPDIQDAAKAMHRARRANGRNWRHLDAHARLRRRVHHDAGRLQSRRFLRCGKRRVRRTRGEQHGREGHGKSAPGHGRSPDFSPTVIANSGPSNGRRSASSSAAFAACSRRNASTSASFAMRRPTCAAAQSTRSMAPPAISASA